MDAASVALATPLWRKGTNGGPTSAGGPTATTPSYSADGITPVFTSGNTAGWAAVAVTPRAGSDVDVQLHDLSTNASTASTIRARSRGPGMRPTRARELRCDGLPRLRRRVLRAAGDTASYSAEIAAATLRPSGVSGPFTPRRRASRAPARVRLSGASRTGVVNQTGDVDRGAVVLGGPQPYQNRRQRVTPPSRWPAGHR